MMDPQVQASFIPKKPLIASATAAPSARIGLVWILAVILFIFSVLAAAGVFFYERYLTGAIAGAGDSLNRAQAAYDPQVIEDLVRLNTRISQARTLLNGHLAPSNIFTFLSENTLQSVRFSDFNYLMNPNGVASVSLSGIAQDFASVALQSDAFSKNRSLKNVLFSDINIDPTTGQVVFKVKADLDPSLNLYKTLLSQSAQGQTAPIIPAGSSSTGTTTPN